MDLPGILKHDLARVVAVCDVDSRRMEQGKQFVLDYYVRKGGAMRPGDVKMFADFRELVKDPAIDAVSISTPDHWHAEPILAAALAGKDVYVQKPFAMTIVEGRALSDVLRARKRAFQIGSQQRSDAPWPQFRRACELVRNGRIGALQTVEVGLPTDPAGEEEPDMPVPSNLNYDFWLGSTPMVPYTEKRVHPQKDYGRPGWLRIEAYSLGMITGWGSHHVDIAHWGMNTELTGPVEIEGRAEFPRKGLWNVHGPFRVEAKYANGVRMIMSDKFPNGVCFRGAEGWIFCSRGDSRVTATDPGNPGGKALAASNPKILEQPIGPNEVHLYKSTDHHLDWLKSIQSRQPAATSPEQAHRSTSACDLAWIAMKLGRKLRWDPVKETFPDDPEANALCSRAQRAPYGIDQLLRKG
jgi:predicted dehydrogenase